MMTEETEEKRPPTIVCNLNPIGTIVVLHADGRVDVNPDFMIDDAAKEFWKAVETQGQAIRAKAIEDCAKIADEHSRRWRERATKADTDASRLNNHIFEAKSLTAESIACHIRALATPSSDPVESSRHKAIP